MKIKLRLLKLFFFIIITSLTIGVGFLINSSVEFIFVEKEIRDFVSRGELYIEVGSISYYQVPKKYAYEDADAHVFDITDYNKLVGSSADILSTTRNPMRGIPFVGFFSRLCWVGHSALVMNDSGSEICEVVGNEDNPKDNFVRIEDNTWIKGDIDSPNILCLRVKDLTQEQKTTITSYAQHQADEQKRYNFLFPIKMTNKYYCTDLVSRSIEEAGINVNYDGFVTTGNDMILSKNTYIIYYRVKIGETYRVYYLVDEVNHD